MPLKRLDTKALETEAVRSDAEEEATKPLPPDSFDLLGANTDTRVRHLGMVMYGSEHPKAVPTQDLLRMVQTPLDPSDSVMDRYQRRVRSPLTAIRAICVDRHGGSPKDVRECGNTSCALWAFRMGNNPFFGKIKERSDEEITDE